MDTDERQNNVAKEGRYNERLKKCINYRGKKKIRRKLEDEYNNERGEI